MSRPDARDYAVRDCCLKMQVVLEDRDSGGQDSVVPEQWFEVCPEIFSWSAKQRRQVPKWFQKMIEALIDLYDQGYADASKQTEEV